MELKVEPSFALAKPVELLRVGSGGSERRHDLAAVEEPLEVRLHGRPFSVIMRTPGADRELVAGFLLAEGVITGRQDLVAIEPGVSGDRLRQTPQRATALSPGTECNVVEVRLTDARRVDELLDSSRRVVTTASCGLCGRRTIESLTSRRPALPLSSTMTARALRELPLRLRERQAGFDATGGLHAAALFTSSGHCEHIAEDVGRHNAVDKVIGRMVIDGGLPLHTSALFVSGRTSFEIVQKAFIAGIPLVAAVSAPSSLAVDLAAEAGMTLVGFVRDDGFNIYTHPDRITAS